MICPNCQTLCGEADHFCYICGTQLVPYVPPRPRKGSRLVPILLLILMSSVGLILFFATAGKGTSLRAAAGSDHFYIRDGVLYFDASRYTGGSELIVPESVAGQTVYTLGENCFANCTDLVEIILPKTLSSIGEGAFYGCTSLRGINIPDSVNIIAEEAFRNCTALEAIHIPGTVHTIREDAFDDCGAMRYIFYSGPYSSWTALYSEFINPYAGVFCEDGSFYQGGDPYG